MLSSMKNTAVSELDVKFVEPLTFCEEMETGGLITENTAVYLNEIFYNQVKTSITKYTVLKCPYAKR